MNIFKNLFKKREYGLPKAPRLIPMPPVKGLLNIMGKTFITATQ
jgi:hypothetical protein